MSDKKPHSLRLLLHFALNQNQSLNCVHIPYLHTNEPGHEKTCFFLHMRKQRLSSVAHSQHLYFR